MATTKPTYNYSGRDVHAARINSWAYANGYLCESSEWTSDDARRDCLARLAAHTRRNGDHLTCRDGSRLEIDEYGMFAV